MYQINSRDTGNTVATVRLDPYRFDMNQPNRDGVRRVLEEMKGVKQMNRTVYEGDEVEVTEDSTSMETYQEPSDDFLLDQIASAVSPGHALVEVGDE